MLTFSKTGCGTSRSYCLVDYLSVTECVNGYGISGKLCLANGTVNYVIVATVSLTSRINVVLYNDATCGVTECVNYILCNEYFVTYGTVLTFSKTGCSTGRCLSCVDYFGVTESCYGFLSNESLATY